MSGREIVPTASQWNST